MRQVYKDAEKSIPNPYPIPALDTEGRWIAGGPVLGTGVQQYDPGWRSKVEIHDRLFSHQTLNSARKDIRYILPEEVYIFRFHLLIKCIS